MTLNLKMDNSPQTKVTFTDEEEVPRPRVGIRHEGTKLYAPAGLGWKDAKKGLFCNQYNGVHPTLWGLQNRDDEGEHDNNWNIDAAKMTVSTSAVWNKNTRKMNIELLFSVNDKFVGMLKDGTLLPLYYTNIGLNHEPSGNAVFVSSTVYAPFDPLHKDENIIPEADKIYSLNYDKPDDFRWVFHKGTPDHFLLHMIWATHYFKQTLTGVLVMDKVAETEEDVRWFGSDTYAFCARQPFLDANGQSDFNKEFAIEQRGYSQTAGDTYKRDGLTVTWNEPVIRLNSVYLNGAKVHSNWFYDFFKKELHKAGETFELDPEWTKTFGLDYFFTLMEHPLLGDKKVVDVSLQRDSYPSEPFDGSFWSWHMWFRLNTFMVTKDLVDAFKKRGIDLWVEGELAT